MSAVVIGALGAQIRAIGNKAFRQATSGAYSFTPAVTGFYEVTTQGGGQGGQSGAARGGQAGMRIVARHLLVGGTSYSGSVGAGGTAGSGAGGNTTFVGAHFTQTAFGGNSSSAARFDVTPADGAPAIEQGGGVLGGAMGGVGGQRGGYCGAFNGGTGATSAGGGGASAYAAGGNGVNPGTGGAGSLGSGGGAGSVAGGAGGTGLVEISWIGAA